MNQADERTRKFFEDYEKGIASSDIDLLAALYSDTFLFASMQGTQAVKKEGFLKVLPKRQAVFQAIGLKSTTLRSLEETSIDEAYSLVKVYWDMHYEKDPQHPTVDENSATYVLHWQGNSAQIVFQLDHQDLMKRAQELGLTAH